jgi:hypothetical protein
LSITPSESVSAQPSTSGSDTDHAGDPSGSSRPKRKRQRKVTRDIVWSFARKPRRGLEPERELSGQYKRRIWYCHFPNCDTYNTLSTLAAKGHLKSRHNIDLAIPQLTRSELAQQDIRTTISQQLRNKREEDDERALCVLRHAVNPPLIY